MGEDLARAFISFFAIVDPVGNTLVFHLLTQSLTRRQQLEVAAAAVGAAGAMLVVFVLGGREVLEFLDISTDGFKIAAGLLLFMPAYRLVEHGQPMDVSQERVEPMQVALVPLATPLLAGPGALAAAISFSDSAGAGTTLVAAALVLGISLIAFAAAAELFTWLGQSTLRLLSRLIGILLVAIAVNFVVEGAQAVFPGLA